MKLVKIKDIRRGQVWKNRKEFAIVDSLYDDDEIQISAYKLSGKPIEEDCYNDWEGLIDGTTLLQDYKLVGVMGITHKIEDNMLVEIPKENFQVDDIVKFNWADKRLYVINREIDFGIKETHPDCRCFEATNDLYGSRQLVDFELRKVGIYGVTHEFVNDREVQDE